MRYELDNVALVLPDEFGLLDITNLNDDKPVYTLCPSRDEQDRIAFETMREYKAQAL